MSDVRLLVTGGEGFVGGHLLPRLAARPGTEILSPSEAECDLTDRAAARRVFGGFRPHTVVHLAAVVGGIGANRASPGRFFHDNMLMGLNVVEESRRAGVSKLVLLGTVCSYPKLAPVPFREDTLWDGYPEETNAPYGVAKKALFTMALAYREQYGLPCACLMPVNLYGPGDHFDLAGSHVIPALVRKCVEGAERGDPEVVVWGSGRATREFLFVEDCADALVRAVDMPPPDGPVNLGAGFEVSIADLARTIALLCGYTGRLVFDPSRPDGQPRRRLDTSRALAHYGWRAVTSLDEGLRRTIEWFRAHRPGG